MRENGYYWIKLKHRDRIAIIQDKATERGWEVAYYEQGSGWSSIWDGGLWEDYELDEIDENRITRINEN